MRTLTPTGGQKTVTAAGTAEAISATKLPAMFVTFQGMETNTTAVHIGDSTVDKATSPQITLDAGEMLTIEAPRNFYIDLAEWYVDAVTNGEGVDYVLGK